VDFEQDRALFTTFSDPFEASHEDYNFDEGKQIYTTEPTDM
jgi:hypothetical protein